MAGAWPERAGDPFADWMNSVQKYVVSDTVSGADVTWQPTTVIRRADMLKEVSACGSGRVASSNCGAARRWYVPCWPPTWSTNSPS